MIRRIWTLYVLLGLFFMGVSFHIYTIITGDITQVAAGQGSYTVSVTSLRGTIYDSHMNPLVNYEKGYRAAVAPEETVLSAVRSATVASEYYKLVNALSNRKPMVVTLTKPVGFVKGLKQFLVPHRYGARLLSPHVIGYLDNAGQGVTGLELAYNDLLQYYAGSIKVTFSVDGIGRYVDETEPIVRDNLSKAQGGLCLTLDRDTQTLIEDLAPQYLERGAIIVMNPSDGAVLAMASFPSFQPNTVAENLENDNSPLLNRAVSLYDCGSVFKIITAAAALESGVSPKQTFVCEGSLLVGDTIFHCHNRLGHQSLTMDDAMANSCNLYFIQLAQQIGAQTLYQMAEQFGVNRPVSLAGNLGTEAGILPMLSELQQSPATLANFSFGQGKLMVSPLHVARITTVIANDGVLSAPYLVKGTVDEQGVLMATKEGRGERIISVWTAQTIKTMLEKVVTEGTGQGAAPVKGMAAGKTGTAETGQVMNGETVLQSWFTGFVFSGDSSYVVTILVENARDYSDSAKKLFCEISNNLIRE